MSKECNVLVYFGKEISLPLLAQIGLKKKEAHLPYAVADAGIT